MKNFRLVMAVTAFSLLLFAGCEKELDTADNPNLAQQNAIQDESKAGSGSLAPYEPQYRALIYRALRNVEPTPCNKITQLLLWTGKQILGWKEEAKFVLSDTREGSLRMVELATYHTAYFQNSPAEQYYGLNGEYTQPINKGFRALKRFWDIQSNNIIVVGLHGSMLQDRRKVVRTFQVGYGYSAYKANQYADSVATLLKTYPEYLNGIHPIFTLNAFAAPDTTYPGVGQVTAKIIMGDGLLQAYEELGYGDVAPQATLAHEFGHQIQFQLGILKPGMKLTPESARRVELMADAYAAYFLSHARGAAMQWKRVQQFLDVFFNKGDCEFNNNTHHGTPTQRRAAAVWAYNLANDARKQGGILSSREFAGLFDAELPNIVKQ